MCENLHIAKLEREKKKKELQNKVDEKKNKQTIKEIIKIIIKQMKIAHETCGSFYDTSATIIHYTFFSLLQSF